VFKAIGLFAASLFFALGAHADSVNWSVGPVSISLHAQGFTIAEVEPTITCRLSDGSGAFSKNPSTTLKSTLTEDTSFTGKGKMYKLEIDGGNVKGSQVFAKRRSCTYVLGIYSNDGDSEPLSGHVTLAWADDQSNLDEFIADKNLNEKINADKALINLGLSDNKAVIITLP